MKTHPFFEEIKNYPDLATFCNTEITELPEAYIGKGEIKAVLLGADPTNNGIKTDKGQKQLKTVFGIDEFNEFFRPQLSNLKQIGLTIDNLYIQNVCRNYFTDETSKNKNWNKVAQLWLRHLKEELDAFDSERKLPLLATSEVIVKALVKQPIAKPKEVYEKNLSFVSDVLDRKVYAFYRHPAYALTSETNMAYRDFLMDNLV